MAILSNRKFLNILLAVGAAFLLLFVAAEKIHDGYSQSLAVKVQSNLAKIQSDYDNRLIELRGVSLLFVGDVMLSRSVGRRMEKNADYRYPFLESAETLRGADLTFGNLEGPISSRGTDQGSEYSFRADPRAIEGLKFAGFDVLSIANNHIWDWGGDALVDTVALLREGGIEAVGAGQNYKEANRPIIKRVGNTSIAFLAYTDRYPDSFEATEGTPGISDFDVQNVGELIGKLRKEVDIIVISLHWGEEYADEPSISQKNTAHSLIDAGASIVIGHHPHVVQKVESYSGGWIVYSLGNFVFDQNFSPQTMEGLAIIANIRNRRMVNTEELPVYILNSFQPTFVKL